MPKTEKDVPCYGCGKTTTIKSHGHTYECTECSTITCGKCGGPADCTHHCVYDCDE